MANSLRVALLNHVHVHSYKLFSHCRNFSTRVQPVQCTAVHGSHIPSLVLSSWISARIESVEIRITGEDGVTPLPENAIGRLQIRGLVVTPGYVNCQPACSESRGLCRRWLVWVRRPRIFAKWQTTLDWKTPGNYKHPRCKLILLRSWETSQTFLGNMQVDDEYFLGLIGMKIYLHFESMKEEIEFLYIKATNLRLQRETGRQKRDRRFLWGNSIKWMRPPWCTWKEKIERRKFRTHQVVLAFRQRIDEFIDYLSRATHDAVKSSVSLVQSRRGEEYKY